MSYSKKQDRKAAVLPTFLVMLPMVLVFCGFAINLAYVQMTHTQMKIAVDAAAHAGGRALGTPAEGDQIESLAQAKSRVKAKAREIGLLNQVAGQPADIPLDEMKFGRSVRANNGPYKFTELSEYESTKIPSSFAIDTVNVSIPLIFKPMRGTNYDQSMRTFAAGRASVSTQVDRDIALVLDRSGSMLTYENEDGLNATLLRLKNETYTAIESQREREYYVQDRSNNQWGWYTYNNLPNRYRYYGQKRWTYTEQEVQRQKISDSEYSNATKFSSSVPIYYRSYSDNVIMWLERDANPSDTLGESFNSNEHGDLTVPAAIYAYDYQYRYQNNYGGRNWAPRYSRWYYADRGVSVFMNVLAGGTDPNGTVRDGTIQEEKVGLVLFNSYTNYDHNKHALRYIEAGYSGNLDDYHDEIAGIVPDKGTAIGDSLTKAKAIVGHAATARVFAAKTIVILTDGDNTVGSNPETVASNEIAGEDITVHTVTFTQGVSNAGKQAMSNVASIGAGRHYHTDSGEQLSRIFEEIANNLPTILTY